MFGTRRILPERLALRPTGRDMSIRRVNVSPGLATFYRQSQGSSIDGPHPEFIACSVTGKFDPYGIRRSAGSTERVDDTGHASQMRYRFEVPTPTDQNDVLVDIERGDHVVVATSTLLPDNVNDFRVIDIVVADGYIACLLELWQ